MYAPSPEKWRGIYSDVWRWRKTDQEFDSIVTEYIQKTTGKKSLAGGRPRLDNGDKSWQQEYCEALIRFNGNKEKAAQVTPYSFEQIYEMTNPTYGSYDSEFSKMVLSTELKLAAKAEEMVFSALSEENFVDLHTAKIAQTKVWIATKILEKMDKNRWGKDLNVRHSGSINHIQIPREKILATLVDEQKKYLEASKKYEQEVIEGDIVE